ncbi:MAG TPA: TIGR03790 family protein, partial [Bryobacteraceae bacterium]|nr:TIGR03790 family protein [Bryobacteraceae bacterium]
SPQVYDTQVVAPIRAALTSKHLQDKVICLVSFWGVPLRIGGRSLPATAKAERTALQTQLGQELLPEIQRQVASAEEIARRFKSDFRAGDGKSVQQLAVRTATALGTAYAAIAQLPDTPQRQDPFNQLLPITERLLGSDVTSVRLAEPGLRQLAARPPSTREAIAARDRLLAARQRINQLSADQQDPKTREQIRNIARQSGGLLGYADQVQLQVALLDDDKTVAALDNELALLWWPDYPKARWLNNPLFWRNAGRGAAARTLMVTRLDGPTAPIVHDIIATSVKVEQQGLQGQVVLDGLGRPLNTPYGPYDQTIRNLAGQLKEHTKLKVTYDDKEALFAAHSLKDIAVYCGWYSVRNYVPPGQFNAGAVGFHVASFELVTLRTPGEKGWVRGLQNDGAVATVGAVDEPYLQSFPLADEFFPLLLCGKLTYAEVFWRTNPWVSWRQACIGDPLYRPYMRHPAVDPSVLPEAMAEAVR